MTERLDEKTIIELFNQGGSSANDAFTHIVIHYGPILYNQIRGMARNHELTNDILQNVFIKVFQNLPKFKGDSALYTWMYRIARNESLNYLEKEKRRTGVDIDTPILEIIAGHHVLDATTPELVTQILQEAISTLPEKQALVFEMKYFQDLKYADISQKLNTSEGALKASFHHAKKKIEAFILTKLNH
ncbi:MAG TPA: sigma-70 family RNA polymerase sigma factor [Crocinitomicaceae bacterium]|nr:sigma-70 family RNA polymerase sigma factor [Crocinitomicaceae bacterium]